MFLAPAPTNLSGFKNLIGLKYEAPIARNFRSFPAPSPLKLWKTLQNKPDCNGSRRKLGRNEKREQTEIVTSKLLFLKKQKQAYIV